MRLMTCDTQIRKFFECIWLPREVVHEHEQTWIPHRYSRKRKIWMKKLPVIWEAHGFWNIGSATWYQTGLIGEDDDRGSSDWSSIVEDLGTSLMLITAIDPRLKKQALLIWIDRSRPHNNPDFREQEKISHELLEIANGEASKT